MENRIKLDALTGIRFFAASFIVIGHAHGIFGSAGIATTFALQQGVSIFFVLSGFILAYSYPKLSNLQEVGRFLLARFARLWPLHITAIILLVFLIPMDKAGYMVRNHQYAMVVLNLLLLQSWTLLKNMSLSLNGVAWSISVEIFFYLAFPLLLWRWRQNWPLKIILALAFLVMCIVTGNHLNLTSDDNYPGFSLFGLIYTNPLARIFEFTMGIATYFLFVRLKPLAEDLRLIEATFLEAVTVVLAVASMWLTPILAYQPGVLKVVGMAGGRWICGSGTFLLFSLLILTIAFQRGLISRFLAHPVMVLLGEISFAVYLTHTIVLQVFSNYTSVLLDYPTLGLIAYWATVLLLAYLLFSIIEQPCRRAIVSLPSRLRNGKVSLAWPNKRTTACLFGLVFLIGGMKYGAPMAFNHLDCLTHEKVEQVVAQSDWHDTTDAIFGQDFILLAIDLKQDNKEMYELQLFWKAQRDTQLKYKVAIHLMDDDNKIVSINDYVQSQQQITVRKGTIWRDRVRITAGSLAAAKRLGVAVYERPDAMKYLLPVVASNTDWGGRRLVILNFGLSASGN